MTSNKRILKGFFVFLLISGIRLHSQQTVAHVLEISGEWRIHGSAGALTAGQGLTAGATIDAVSNHPGDSIALVRDDDMSRQRVACDASAANPCRNPIPVAAPAADQSSGLAHLKGMLQAAVGVLLSNPPAIGSHYAMTLSRGADNIRELEGVAALDPAEGVVLPAPPEDLEAGPYTLTIGRPGDQGSRIKQDVRLTSDGAWRPISLTASGLYEITVRDGQQENVANLMVLVTAPAEYQDKQQRFAALKAQADTWTGPGAREDEHLLLRAFLLSESRP